MKRTDRHQGQLPVKVEVNGDDKASRRRSSEQSGSNERHSGNGRAYEKKSEVERKSITTRSLTANNQPVGVVTGNTSRLSTSNLRATHEIESSLPTIALNGDEIDDIGSGFRPEEDDFTGEKGGNSALNATTKSSSYSLNTRMSRSGRNKVAAEMAYLTTMSAYPDGRPITPTRRGRRASKDAPRLSTSRQSRLGGELGKMEATAAGIVEDAIQKALEALHGKQNRRSQTLQNISSSTVESTSLGVSGNASEIAEMRRATQEMSSQRNKKSVSYSNSTLQADEQLQRNSIARSLRDEQYRDSITERQNRSSLSKQRQLSSESTTTGNVHRQRNFYDIGDASGGYYGSSEWYGSDLYLSPVQTYQRNSVSSSGRRVSGYASDTALWSPPIHTSNKPPQLSMAAASGWRSGSTDSDFSTTLEIKKKKRVDAVSDWNAVGNVSSLDRGLQRRPNRAPTLTKGMVTKILHGAMESDDVAMTSSSSAVQSHQNQARSRSADLFSSKQKTFDRPVHVATPTGFNVSSMPAVYNANTFQQSSAAGGKQLIVDVVDQRNSRMRSASTEPFMTSSPLTVGEGTSWTTTARSMTASPTYRRFGGVRSDFDAARYQTVYSSDDEATTPSAAGLRLQQATDRRIDLVFDPGQLYRQQPKVRVFGEHSSGGIRSPSGLPSIAESDLERRHHQQLTSNSYAAFSNEPIIVADLMDPSGRVESANDNRLQQQQNGFHQMRRSQSADDLDGIRSGSGTPIFSTTARPDINMVKSQVLNLYLFNRGDQPTGPDQRRPGRQDETVTRTMEFDDEIRRTSRQTQTSIRRKEVVQVPVVVESPPQIQREITHYVTTERERAPLPTVERKLTSNAAVQVETGTVEEIPIERELLVREDSPIPLAFQQFFEPPTPAPPQRRKNMPVLPANVTQETVIRKPTVVETRQIEMTGDVFESRPIPEPEVVRLREPEVEMTNVVEDSVEEDEEEMLETEVIEEKEQRIEMTIREDIEFSLQRSQGSMKPIDGDADGGNKRVNIEPWWIPPKFEAIVDHKKQKITQVKDIENKDDYSKKVDKGNESVVENDDVNSRSSSYQPIVSRANHRPYNDEYSHQPISVDKPFKITSDIMVDAASSTTRPTVASATDFEVPVVVEDAYRSPVLTVEPRSAPFFSSSGGSSSSSRPYLYGKTDYSSEKLQQSPVRQEKETDRSFPRENGSGTDTRQQLQNNNQSNSEPKSDKRHYVTSYTKYISAPSQSPLSSWNNRKYLAHINADISASDAPVSESGHGKGSHVTTGKTFPRSIIALPSPPAMSSAGGGGASHEYYYDTSGGLSDADDRLPESLDHFDRMLSHLEREYLSASVLDDVDYQTRSKQQLTTATAPAEHKRTHNDVFGSRNDAVHNVGRQVAAAANLPNSDKPHQLPQSANDRKGNGTNHSKGPPPPPPLKSWKAGAENRDRNAPNNYTSQVNTNNASSPSESAASKLQRSPAVKTTAKLTIEPRPPIEGRVEKQTKNASFYPPTDTAAVTRPGSYGTGGRPHTKPSNDVSYTSTQDEETDEHHFSRQLGDHGYMSLSLAANESDARSGRWTTDHGQVSADDDRMRPTNATNSSPVFLSSGWKSLDRYRNVDRQVDGSSLLEQIAEQRQKLRGSIYKNDAGTTSGGSSNLDPSGYETAVTAL